MFEPFALELFELQFETNLAYRRVCEGQGISPATIRHWSEVPAVPTQAFKEYEMCCIPSGERTAVFHSSGTTGEKPSRHFHHAASLALYETSLWSWFQQSILKGSAIAEVASLTPGPGQTPHSSLVHMFEVIRRKLGAAEGTFLGTVTSDGSWRVSMDEALGVLEAAAAAGRPVLLVGTAFLYVHLFDYLVSNEIMLKLPSGSLVLETGGYKGRSRILPKADLHALMRSRLGVSRSQIVCEYGMSELSSQAYDRAGGVSTDLMNQPAPAGPFCFPPWARVRIVSPETGREVGEGEVGLVRVYDLANAYSAMAVQTEDLAVKRGAGFELIGRANLAEPRGCSLMAS